MKQLKMILIALALVFAVQNVVTVQEVQAATTSSKKNGLKKSKGSYYYYKGGKKVTKQWVTIKGKKYYFTKSGAAATGWNKISGKAYYFNAKGVMQKNKKIDGIKLNKKGAASLKKANVQLKLQTVAVTKKQKTLRKCYNYVSKFTYRMKTDSIEKKNWEIGYALSALNDKKGNCYSLASAFAMLARELGYDAKIVTGTMIKGEQTERVHAWVEIDGKVYDPQSQNNMPGSNFYERTYEQITEIEYKALKRI